MHPLRVALLTALLGFLALLIAWGLRSRAPRAAGPAVSRASEPEAPPAKPPKRDFPRRPPPQDEVFTNAPEDEAPGPEHPWQAYLGKIAAIEERLRANKHDLDFTDTSLLPILAELEKATGLTFNVDCPADISGKKISIAVKDLLVAHTLRLLLQQYDLRWVVSEDGGIWIVPSGTPPEQGEALWPHEPDYMADIRGMRRIAADRKERAKEAEQAEKDRATRATIRETRVTCDFVGASLADAVSHLQEASQLNVMIDRRWIEDLDAMTVTATMKDARLEDALSLCLGARDLGWMTSDGVLVVTSKDRLEMEAQTREGNRLAREKQASEEGDLLARSVAFGGENLRLRDVADMLAKGLGVPWKMDPATWNCRTRFSIEERQRPASDIVRVLRKGAPLVVMYRGGILWFLSPESLK
ncbi:MAG: STN domain-containing protein [Planctomycetia bacterium]|nr:STN domain-containing protein [Planctomycetia bacterium]